MPEPTWATEDEREQKFQQDVDEAWESWWNSMPHAVRYPNDNDPED